jgi:methyl-accepting chemotaxis protein
MESEVEKLALVFIIIIGIFVIIQVSMLAGIFLSIRKLVANIEQLRESVAAKTEPALADFRDVLGEAKHIVRGFQATTENFAGISETVKYQVERVNAVIEDTTDRARDQIARADEVVTDAIEKMQATSAIVQQHVLAPVREVSALIRGVSGGLQFLFSRKRNQVDAVHQDEELFI